MKPWLWSFLFLEEALRGKGEVLEGKKIIVYGSGNVAIYADEKAIKRSTVIAMSDSKGYIYDRKWISIHL
jgi:glutamate dehydrogenase (NADP+)